MGGHMKRSHRRKSRKSRKRRGGKIPNICKRSNLFPAMKEECAKMEAKAKEMKKMASEAVAAAPTKDLKNKFKGVAKKVGQQASVAEGLKKDVAATEKAVKGAAPELKAKLEKQFRATRGGKRKRHRTKRRRKSRKSKKSRRKSRKTKRRRKSKKRRSRRRR